MDCRLYLHPLLFRTWTNPRSGWSMAPVNCRFCVGPKWDLSHLETILIVVWSWCGLSTLSAMIFYEAVIQIRAKVNTLVVQEARYRQGYLPWIFQMAGPAIHSGHLWIWTRDICSTKCGQKHPWSLIILTNLLFVLLFSYLEQHEGRSDCKLLVKDLLHSYLGAKMLEKKVEREVNDTCMSWLITSQFL